MTVAFQFNDNQVVHVHLLSADQIVEVYATVNGQSLCHSFVYQRDAGEVVVECWLQTVNVIVQVLAKEELFFLVSQVHIYHLDALFLSALVVVLCLHLHKLQSVYAVGPETYLLSVGMLPLMHAVHIEVVSIVVCGVILQIALSVNFLHVVFIACHLQQLLELVQIGNEFRISAIHELHATHLVK